MALPWGLVVPPNIYDVVFPNDPVGYNMTDAPGTTGAYGVSEPAAMRYAQVESLVLTKKKSGNATISVARLVF
ncbi:hypothetical protein LSPH26S_05069 [Lysinibacillus sphaericus]